jgi:predicted metal-dependent enzyme (double-stranded beta helix superfamily)
MIGCPWNGGNPNLILPPLEDIHRVRTTLPTASVPIHLLANDTGCAWRHAYDPVIATVRPFRPGYVNRPCLDEGVQGRRGAG